MKKDRLFIALVLFVYLIIGTFIKVYSSSIYIPLQYLDTTLDSTVCLAVKLDAAMFDSDTVKVKETSFPKKDSICITDDDNWVLQYKWYWPGRSDLTSEFISFGSGAVGTSNWSDEQIDSVLNLTFRTGATIGATEIATDAITSDKIAANAIGLSENSAMRYLSMLLTVYNNTRSYTIYGNDKDSVIVKDSLGSTLVNIVFYHPGGNPGDAPDSVWVK